MSSRKLSTSIPEEDLTQEDVFTEGLLADRAAESMELLKGDLRGLPKTALSGTQCIALFDQLGLESWISVMGLSGYEYECAAPALLSNQDIMRRIMGILRGGLEPLIMDVYMYPLKYSLLEPYRPISTLGNLNGAHCLQFLNGMYQHEQTGEHLVCPELREMFLTLILGPNPKLAERTMYEHALQIGIDYLQHLHQHYDNGVTVNNNTVQLLLEVVVDHILAPRGEISQFISKVMVRQHSAAVQLHRTFMSIKYFKARVTRVKLDPSSVGAFNSSPSLLGSLSSNSLNARSSIERNPSIRSNSSQSNLDIGVGKELKMATVHVSFSNEEAAATAAAATGDNTPQERSRQPSIQSNSNPVPAPESTVSPTPKNPNAELSSLRTGSMTMLQPTPKPNHFLVQIRRSHDGSGTPAQETSGRPKHPSAMFVDAVKSGAIQGSSAAREAAAMVSTVIRVPRPKSQSPPPAPGPEISPVVKETANYLRTKRFKEAVLESKKPGYSDELLLSMLAGWSHEAGSALLEAARTGNLELAQLLVEGAGAPLEMHDDNDRTPLYLACREGKMEVARYLIGKGANIAAVQRDGGANRLFIACQEGTLETVKSLLGRGVNVNAVNVNGVTALHIACQYGHLELVRYLIDSGANIEAATVSGVTPLYVAAQNGHVEVARLMLYRGASTEAAQKDGCTPIYIAAQNGHVDVVKLLHLRGANVEVIARGMNGNKPMHAAVHFGRFEVLKFLVEIAGADFTYERPDGRAPVDMSKNSNADPVKFNECVEYLLSKAEGQRVSMPSGRQTMEGETLRSAMAQANVTDGAGFSSGSTWL